MSLSSAGTPWHDCKITTPTFSLTPVEKPDASPFLIHMTGRDSLVNILKGENRLFLHLIFLGIGVIKDG